MPFDWIQDPDQEPPRVPWRALLVIAVVAAVIVLIVQRWT